MPDTCKTCRFYVHLADCRNGYGECHRHAPMCDASDESFHDGSWPTVFGSYWCGDYEPTVEKLYENLGRKLKRMTR